MVLLGAAWVVLLDGRLSMGLPIASFDLAANTTPFALLSRF